MKKKSVIILSIITVVIIGAIIAVKIIYSDLEQNLNNLKSMTIDDVDLTKIPDGIYTGSYEAFPVAATVEVTIKDHISNCFKISLLLWDVLKFIANSFMKSFMV